MSKMSLIAQPDKQEVIITCSLDAPRELVFKAYTDPTLLAQWWGPRKYRTVVDKLEVKQGGIWRFLNVDTDGHEYGFHGIFHLITPPQQLVFTFEFEGTPGHVLMETVTLGDRDGKTFLTDQSVFQSVEDRDGMVKEGMEWGARESMERLAELVKIVDHVN